MAVLVIGASGLVGYEFFRQNRERKDWFFTYNTHKIDNFIHLDATDLKEIEDVLKKISPDTLIVTAALPDVNKCETDKDLAYKTNVGIIENILKFMPKEAKIVFFSTDYIFDGENGPYSETDKPNPINYYGRLKLICENNIISSGLDHLIIRTTGIFGWEKQRKNFLCRVIDTLTAGKELLVPNDQFGNPTYVKDLISAINTLLDKGCSGTYNVAGSEWIQREDFARKIARSFGLNENLIVGKATSYFKDIAPRPLKAGFKTEKIKKIGILMKPIDEALEDMIKMKNVDDIYK